MADPSFANKGLDASQASIAYAVTFPVGVPGIVFLLILLKAMWKIDMNKEQGAYEKSLETDPDKPHATNLDVTNATLFGKATGKNHYLPGAGKHTVDRVLCPEQKHTSNDRFGYGCCLVQSHGRG